MDATAPRESYSLVPEVTDAMVWPRTMFATAGRLPDDEDALHSLRALVGIHDRRDGRISDMLVVADTTYEMQASAGATFDRVPDGLQLQTQRLVEVLLAVAAYEYAPTSWIDVARSAAPRLRPNVHARMKPWMEALVAIFSLCGMYMPANDPNRSVRRVLEELNAIGYDIPKVIGTPRRAQFADAARVLRGLRERLPDRSWRWKITADPRKRAGGRAGWVTPHGAAVLFAAAFGVRLPKTKSAAARDWSTTNAIRREPSPTISRRVKHVSKRTRDKQ